MPTPNTLPSPAEQEPTTREWIDRLRAFLPPFFERHPPLAEFADGASLVLHGSLTMGVRDAFTDLDIWFLLPDDEVRRFKASSPFTFFTFKLDGKKGHVNVHGLGEFAQRVQRCDMDLIYQLRRAEIMAGGADGAQELIQLASKPMRTEVSEGLFFHHYVEMRGEHRACDNPIERNDPIALLLFLPKTLGHALRAAIVLDGEPYPYDKWLFRAACETPAGRQVAPHVECIVSLLAEDALRLGGPEKENPISLELRAVRQVLRDAARAKDLDAPWLTEWWLYMDPARDVLERVSW